MHDIISQMIVLFILIIVGYVARKCRMMDAEGDRRLSGLVINLTCPCLILSSVMGNAVLDKSLVLPLLTEGFSTYIFLILVSWCLSLFVKHKDKRGLYRFMLTFGNVGFIGYPVVASVWGENAIFYASLLNFPNTLFAFSIGMAQVAGYGQHVKFNYRILGYPAMIASYLSILIVLMDWGQIPDMITRPVKLLGDITVPAALLIIGSSMAQIPMKQMFGSPMVYATSMLRLLVLPLVVFCISKLSGVDETVLQINTLLSAMPVATYGTMFCLQFGKDDTFMTQGIFISTLLSVITIPIMVLLLL